MAGKNRKPRRIKMLFVLGVAIFIGFLIFQILYIKYAGTPVARPEIARDEQIVGSGSQITYAILGDSTALSQGGDYGEGYAAASARYLAQKYSVRWKNVAVSGSRSRDVLQKQIPEIIDFKPDIVLIAVGANDVTHLTIIDAARDSLKEAVKKLREANPAVRIIVTGSPDMGSLPRFPQPVRWLAGFQTERFNEEITELAAQEHLVFAPIAKETGPTFRAHPELFAADKFHPTTEGYKIWIPVIQRAIDQALGQ